MTEPRKFRKLPILVEAALYDGSRESAAAIIEWTMGQVTLTITNDLAVPTQNGITYATKGDWVIRAPHGGFYPCSPSTFSETYEEADGYDELVKQGKIIPRPMPEWVP